MNLPIESLDCNYEGKVGKEARNQKSVAGGGSKSTKRVLNGMALYFTFLTFVRGLGVFMKPQSPEWLSSLAQNPQALPLSIKILIGLFHGYTIGFTFFSFVFHASVMFCYVAAILPAVERIT
jgi:hypothetical protein